MKHSSKNTYCQTDVEQVFGFLPTLVPIKPELKPSLRRPSSFETKEELYAYNESRRIIERPVHEVPGGTVTTAMSNRNFGTRYGASGNLVSIINTGHCCPIACVGTVRGQVSGLSASACSRMRGYLRACSSRYKEMVTLTYPNEYPTDGRQVKEHLRRFTQEVRREIQRTHGSSTLSIHSIFWFLEFQERGAPHFHLFLTKSPSKWWVADTWAGIVDSGDIRHINAGTRTEYLRTGRGGTISYACKYAAKQAQKTVPVEYINVGRMWGINGVRKVLSASTIVPREVAGEEMIAKATITFKKVLERMISEGNAKVILQKEDVVLIIVKEDHNQALIRMLIKNISKACYGDKEGNFIDAELENGS